MPPNINSSNDNIRTQQSNSKLSRLINSYEFDELGSQLEDYWVGEATDSYSLRELAEYVNHRLLRTVMHDANLNPLDGEVENIYRLLTDDDVSTGMQTQARRRLERADVDVDQLNADFVSRQAIHTYLTSVRGVSYTTEDRDPVETETTNIRRLKRHTTTITDDKIAQLRDTDHITLGTFKVLLDIRVLCEDCGAQYQVSDLLEKRTCECENGYD